jgi:hypothetical protein
MRRSTLSAKFGKCLLSAQNFANTREQLILNDQKLLSLVKTLVGGTIAGECDIKNDSQAEEENARGGIQGGQNIPEEKTKVFVERNANEVSVWRHRVGEVQGFWMLA